MRICRLGVLVLFALTISCGEPTGPDALEESTFTASLEGATDGDLSGEASLTEATANFPDDLRQDVWLLSLTAHRPGGRTTIEIVGGTVTPETQRYSIISFDPPLSRHDAFGVVNVFEGDSVTERYLARSGEVTMTRVTSREAFGTFRLEARGGDSWEDSTEVTASGDFRAYH